jgi:protein O-mannosyl-transferase
MPAQGHPAEPPTLKRIPVLRTDWLRLAGGAVLVAGALATYSRTFSVPLLFDDNAAIVNNPTIRHWSTAFWPAASTTASGRPVLNLSLAFNYGLSGTAVWSYHTFNLAIHILAGLTLFGIVRRTLERRGDAAASLIGFSAALLWTLHPLQTESVTYIVQRAESLMGLFYLVTLYCFIRAVGADVSGPLADRVPSEYNLRSWWNQGHLQPFGDSGGLPNAAKAAPPATGRCVSCLWSALCVATCLLGMATKEVMVSAPLIVLLYDRTFIAGSFREAWRRRRGLHMALAATWLLLAGLVASTGWNRNGDSGFDVGIKPGAYWLTQFEAVVRYLWLSVWPHPLVFEYGTFFGGFSPEVALYALVVVGLAVAVLVALRRRPPVGFLGAWFFMILAPTSIIPGRVQMIVEHRMYLPLAAVIVGGAAGLCTVLQRVRPRVVIPAVLLLALGLGGLTALRNEDYRSELGIWSDTVAKRPNNERALVCLGDALSKIPGRLDDAIARYEEALRLNPNLAQAHNNLGKALNDEGRTRDAIAQYEDVLRLNPGLAVAHNNLGSALNAAGRINEAIVQYEEALRLKPDLAEAHGNLGNALNAAGRTNEAIVQYEEALRLAPDDAQTHAELGLALEKTPGRLDDAIAQYEDALRLKPDDAEAHYNLGNALGDEGRAQESIAHYEQALRLKPDFAEAHYNLGVALAHRPGRLNDAVAQYEQALRLKPDDAEAHNNLGNALNAQGRTQEAIAQYQAALRLKPDDAATHFNIAVVLLKAPGGGDEAAAHLETVLRLQPGNETARKILEGIRTSQP